MQATLSRRAFARRVYRRNRTCKKTVMSGRIRGPADYESGIESSNLFGRATQPLHGLNTERRSAFHPEAQKVGNTKNYDWGLTLKFGRVIRTGGVPCLRIRPTKRTTKRPTGGWVMPDFLTRRNGTWHFVRRVPVEFAVLDPRRVVRHSTKVRVASDPDGT